MKRFAIILALTVGAAVLVAVLSPLGITVDGGPTINARCISNLKLIDAAKTQWALEKQKNGDAVPTMSDLAPYMKRVPACPAGGLYTVGSLSKPPRCSVKGHSLDH
jgi:hypothetical protein